MRSVGELAKYAFYSCLMAVGLPAVLIVHRVWRARRLYVID
ncbi:MAG: hypothetical protein RI903_1231, partial [Bacteroidota bacterium]